MRVLHLHSGNLYGGVETLLLSLARFRALAPSMEMSAALTSDGRIADELRDAGIPVVILGDVRLSRPHTVRRARHALASVLRSAHPDVVVCHQAWPLAVFGPVARRGSAPLVLWMHMAATRHWLNRLAWRFRPRLVVCNSHFTASTLPPSDVRVEVAYAPVAVNPTADPTAREDASGAVVITQVSRMEPLKGHTVLLDALARLDRRSGWMCWLVGGAQRPDEERYLRGLQDHAEAIGIADRVRFLGQRSDVDSLLAQSDIYCQPNLEPEAFGMSFVEALAASLPVVTSAMGGACEIVDDSCGVLVPPRDAGSLAEVLSSLIADRTRRMRLGANGPARARALCDPARQMPRIAEILQGALEPGRPS